MLGVDIKTVNRACGRTLPELHTVLASVIADPRLCRNWAPSTVWRSRRQRRPSVPILRTIVGLSSVLGEYVRAMADGRRDHQETLAIASLLRPLLPQMRSHFWAKRTRTSRADAMTGPDHHQTGPPRSPPPEAQHRSPIVGALP
jgi:hypothetical protein